MAEDPNAAGGNAGGDQGAAAAAAAATTAATTTERNPLLGGAEGGAEGGAGAAAPPSWREDWREALAGDDKQALTRLKRLTAPDDLFKSYRDLEKRLSSGQTFAPPPE